MGMPDDQSWFEKPSNVTLMWILLIMACIVASGAGIVAALFHKMKPHTGVDAIPVFYAIFGFAAFSFIVLAGQHLRRILMRDEAYYDRVENHAQSDKAQEQADG